MSNGSSTFCHHYKINVFVRVTKTIAIFVLIMVIKMILIMFDDRCMNPM